MTTTPGGFLLVLAVMVPFVGVLAAFALGGRNAQRVATVTILAAMWLLAMMAGLADAPPVSRRRLRAALVAGPAVFIAVGAAGVATAGAFLAYPEGLAKPLILVIEWALLPSLALTLGLIMAGAPQRPEDR